MKLLAIGAHPDDIEIYMFGTLAAARAAGADLVYAIATDGAAGGTLDPGWRAVFLRHPDRFLAGTDTWMTSRWEALPGSVTEVRGYLSQLPRDVAEKIAFRNAERLFP